MIKRLNCLQWLFCSNFQLFTRRRAQPLSEREVAVTKSYCSQSPLMSSCKELLCELLWWTPLVSSSVPGLWTFFYNEPNSVELLWWAPAMNSSDYDELLLWWWAPLVIMNSSGELKVQWKYGFHGSRWYIAEWLDLACYEKRPIKQFPQIWFRTNQQQ